MHTTPDAGATRTPSLTVLVCTRDRPDMLLRCLTSVLASADLPDELIVVDQSRDGRSHQVVTALAAGIRHLPDQRSGLSVAQNLGLQRARGEVVLVTDDDCVVDPAWTSAVRTAMALDPQLVLLGGRVLPLGDDAPDRLPVSTRTSPHPRPLDAQTEPWDVGSGNNFAVRRRAALAVGGNDERLGPGAPLLGGADMDLFRRILRTGAHGRYDPTALVLHERATAAERLGRRIPYGYGTGACLVLWRRQGDRRATGLLLRWLRLRAVRVLQGAKQRDLLRLREEVLLLAGTARGLVAGLRGPAGPVTSLVPADADQADLAR